ncbi:cytochrome P450 monooxygenase [Hyaloscypha variabilis]
MMALLPTQIMESVSRLGLVGTLLAIFIIHRIYRAYQAHREYQSDTLFGRQHGCLPPPRLINEKLLGIDRLHQIWEANSDSRLMELFLWHFRRWGDTLDQVFLGTQAFNTIDPLNLQAVLSTKFDDWGFGPRRNITYPLFGDGIFTQEGLAWKHSRELLRPQFTYRQYQDLDILQESVEDLLSCISNAKDSVVDLQTLFFRFTLDTTTAFLFGESVRSLQAGLKAVEFEEAFNIAQSTVAMRFRLGDLYWLIGGRKFRRSCEAVHKFTEEILEKGMSSQNDGGKRDNRYVFLDAISKEYPDRKALRHQMMNILLAGRDTTACLLSWTFYLLVRHPNVMDRLRSEITSAFGDKESVTRADLKQVEYLTNVLKETLRLFPSVSVNQRCAIRTTILPMGGGPDRKSPVLIRRGQSLAYSVYSLHRRADLYGEDAEDFRPERWGEDLGLYRDETTKTWGYLPFNAGPRICLGMDFAMTEAAYAVVRILQRFPNIKLPADEVVRKTGKERQTITLVLSVGDGCRVCFR